MREQLGQAHLLLKNGYLYLFTSFILFSVILFSGVIRGLIFEWYAKPNSSHGFLIPIIVIALIFKKRKALTITSSSLGNLLGIVVLLGGLMIFFAGKVSEVNILFRMGFFIFSVGSVIFVLGTSIARELSFPIAYSFFMIPMPVTFYDALTFPMRQLSTYLTAKALSLFSIIAHIDGTIINLPNARLEIVNACSGMQSVVSVLAIGTLYGYFYFESNLKRVAILLLSPIIAIIANVFRIFITGIISNYYSNELARGLIHEFSGTFVVLTISLTLIWLTSRILEK